MRAFLRRVLPNPLIIGILAGVLWRLTGLQLPHLADRLRRFARRHRGPLALFAMGLGLRKFGISGNVLPAVVLSCLKLLLMPAVALGIALLFGLPPMTAKVVVAAAALPSGVNSYLHRHPVRHRTGAGVQPDDHRHGLRGRHAPPSG